MSPPPATSTSPPGRVAGIDYGTVRIGIALSDNRRQIASPYENYTRSGPQADARRFQRLVSSSIRPRQAIRARSEASSK